MSDTPNKSHTVRWITDLSNSLRGRREIADANACLDIVKIVAALERALAEKDAALKKAEAELRVRVSPAMINAGVQVLRASGALAVELSADYLLVRRILDAALTAAIRAQADAKEGR